MRYYPIENVERKPCRHCGAVLDHITKDCPRHLPFVVEERADWDLPLGRAATEAVELPEEAVYNWTDALRYARYEIAGVKRGD